MTETVKTIRIDPRDFIGGPYQSCPKCGQHEFGVLSIHDTSIMRRCRIRACWYTATFPLPELKKKIIYLDQFVFSNIVKMLSAETRGHERAKAEPLWRELFESLDVLCRMQLVICPDSTEHHAESLISPFYEELKHAYEHFSTGISFERPVSIQHQQVMVAFSAHLEGTKPEFDFDPRCVTSGRLHGWADRFFVTVDGTIRGEKQAIQQSRSKTCVALADVFKEWQKGGETFAQAFEREKGAFAKEILKAYVADHRRRMLTFAGQLPPIPENFLSSVLGSLIHGLEWAAKLHGLSREQTNEAIKSFIESGAMNETPSNIISASMWASLAMRAAAGQKTPPDEGMVTDIDVVSTFLPYCDAMFVDNKCRSLVANTPKTHKLPYRCPVFSSKTSDEFLQYLRDIRASATPEHVALVQEVYGPSVLEPPKSIYGVGVRKRQSE
ncbi:MAG TPA: hypothetical protein VN776_02065 [Terracidiphilus sp.]|nr:hypothetical protein [Terracidiphilus sp.]